ncbi:MAG TPA: hypothetical protein VLD60_05490 [Nitrospira sp.]|nr:hypothetical protein [Nitrospira sp.]
MPPRAAVAAYLLLATIAACAGPLKVSSSWTSLEDVCGPVFVELIPYSWVDEHYFISLDGHDPSDAYISHLKDLAHAAHRSANLKKRSQLAADQASQPLLKAVNISCGNLRWEGADRVRVAAGGLIAPMPGQRFALGGSGSDFVLERRNGQWAIVAREGFWVS